MTKLNQRSKRTVAVVAALIGATVIIKHRANIKRILAGEEPPISFKKSLEIFEYCSKCTLAFT